MHYAFYILTQQGLRYECSSSSKIQVCQSIIFDRLIPLLVLIIYQIVGCCPYSFKLLVLGPIIMISYGFGPYT